MNLLSSWQDLVLAKQEDWSMSSPETQDDSNVSLYFLTNNRTVNANETISLERQGFRLMNLAPLASGQLIQVITS